MGTDVWTNLLVMDRADFELNNLETFSWSSGKNIKEYPMNLWYFYLQKKELQL